jgi:hypothetical protein
MSRLTLLVVTRDLLARADFSGSGAPKVESVARTEDDSLPALVDRAAALGSGLRGPVVVVTDEVAAQTLSVSGAAVRDLKPEEMTRVLSFEAQTLSGISAADSAFSWRHAHSEGGQQEYWVAQMLRADRDQVDDAVRRRGGRLKAIVPAAGLPAPLFPIAGAAGSWVRHEIWHDAVATVASNGGAPRVRLEPGDPSRWRPDAVNEDVRIELLVGAPVRSAAADAEHARRLADPEILTSWLRSWADVLARRDAPVPAIPGAVRPLPIPMRVAIATGLLVAVIGAAWLHHRALEGRRNDLRKAVAEARQPATQLQKFRANTAAMEKELKELEATVAASTRDMKAIERSRWLPATLLETIANGRPRTLTLDGIHLTQRSTRLSGMCFGTDAPDELARTLEKPLAEDGWRVLPPSRTLLGRDERGEYYSFEIEIRPPSEKAAPAKESP